MFHQDIVRFADDTNLPTNLQCVTCVKPLTDRLVGVLFPVLFLLIFGEFVPSSLLALVGQFVLDDL